MKEIGGKTMNSKKYVKTILIMCLIVMLAIMGCSKNNTKTSKESNSQSFEIPEAGTSGGYEIDSDSLYCTVLVDSDYKYAKFESKTGGHTVEYYASPTEMIIIDKNEGEIKYCKEAFEDVDQIYTNPLKAVYEDLQELEFELVEKEDEFDIYQAIKLTQTVEQQQINYTKYKIEITWTDEKQYIFSYYQYEDGSTLISSEAPDGINNRITTDTKWEVDLDNQCVRNTETNEEVAFQVIQMSTGQALSPDGNETTTVESKSYVHIYVNKGNGLIEKMQYSDNEEMDGLAVKIVNDVKIVKPEITDDMTEMTSNELQLSMMLISMIESII